MSTPPRAEGRSPYIVSPAYDWSLFLLPPTMALIVGILIAGSEFADGMFEFWEQDVTWSRLLIGIFIHAHLVAVFFRSHGNPKIRKLYPRRFLLVPPLLYAAMMMSPWVLVSVSVLATFWDVYHSGLQTFGFARIYDGRAGNDPQEGRRLDWWLNHLLYAGPILAGATMMDHFEDFHEFRMVGSVFFTSIPAFMESNQRYFAWAVIAAGTLFLLYYLFANYRLHRAGRTVSPQKVFLLTTTGACSIYTWGFNSWGEAFFIMNLFHALQYFGLVWASEKKHMVRLFRLENAFLGKQIAWLLFFSLVFGYGYFVEALDAEITWLWGITLVVAIMHFWYDGFIWSVAKRQV